MRLLQTISASTFNKWVFQDNENRKLLYFALAVTVVAFTWLKVVYPYPNFMNPDSNSYIEAAFNNDLIDIWPIGYSKFLRLVSCFSSSHFILVLLQYLLLQVTLLHFLFSIRFLLTPGKWAFRIIFAFCISNPLLPHIANFVSSDCLFTSISLLWFTQLLWILYNPTLKLIVFHAITLTFAFTIRLSSAYYPFLSVLIISYAHIPIKIKLQGIVIIISLLFFYIGRTQYEYSLKTGTVQFSAFSGWQIAANALYGYAHSNPIDTLKIPFRFRKLHSIVNKHMDSIHNIASRPDQEVAIYYMWDFKSPLKVYKNQIRVKDSTSSVFKNWAKVAPLYKKYGIYLISKSPLSFSKYYIWPNLIKYYAPPANFMGRYNFNSKNITQLEFSWFGWKKNKYIPGISNRITITNLFTLLFGVINFLFIASVSIFLRLKLLKNQYSSFVRKVIEYTFITWLINLLFSVFAAPIELRYQLFPMLFMICFTIFLLSLIIEKDTAGFLNNISKQKESQLNYK